ncbi:unnamed protein product [Vitrella brassicaformis CCMP3155]|uniref:Uncharacterized protein n=1 Tax=Vitrella brassicaformis (strain CCMP3155) TaxID=1169540 RepID=A0A0G4GJ24_VITBC|nr:unnamed protein product [Vitrella brassicaformis CCMP3155]|mmetsp:Transcript_34288/g.84927  ORF Transcript_34288/g.84927 Transcript_34288/m.84927 type:complete len:359 (-) Transcript_34288:612-1688(-)|eukprot:CEM29837.1 unnamed protein product [Vitrella brassicaformis CCMP3155]
MMLSSNASHDEEIAVSDIHTTGPLTSSNGKQRQNGTNRFLAWLSVALTVALIAVSAALTVVCLGAAGGNSKEAARVNQTGAYPPPAFPAVPSSSTEPIGMMSIPDLYEANMEEISSFGALTMQLLGGRDGWFGVISAQQDERTGNVIVLLTPSAPLSEDEIYRLDQETQEEWNEIDCDPLIEKLAPWTLTVEKASASVADGCGRTQGVVEWQPEQPEADANQLSADKKPRIGAEEGGSSSSDKGDDQQEDDGGDRRRLGQYRSKVGKLCLVQSCGGITFRLNPYLDAQRPYLGMAYNPYPYSQAVAAAGAPPPVQYVQPVVNGGAAGNAIGAPGTGVAPLGSGIGEVPGSVPAGIGGP